MTTAPVTREQLDEWAALAEKATPGPWEWEGDYPKDAPCPHDTEWCDHGPDLRAGDGGWVIVSMGYDASHLDIEDADAAFIAAAREAIPALIARVKELEGRT